MAGDERRQASDWFPVAEELLCDSLSSRETKVPPVGRRGCVFVFKVGGRQIGDSDSTVCVCLCKCSRLEELESGRALWGFI